MCVVFNTPFCKCVYCVSRRAEARGCYMKLTTISKRNGRRPSSSAGRGPKVRPLAWHLDLVLLYTRKRKSDNGEGGRSAGGRPAGAGLHPVSADQCSPGRGIITTKWGVSSSQITLYKQVGYNVSRKCCMQNKTLLTSCVRHPTQQQWVECDCQFPRLYWFQVLSGSGLLVSRHISQLSGTKFPHRVREFESILQLREERRGVIRREKLVEIICYLSHKLTGSTTLGLCLILESSSIVDSWN